MSWLDSVAFTHLQSLLSLHNLQDGKLVTTFPVDIGYILDLSGSRKDCEIFYHFTSFLTPGIIYHCDLTTPTISPVVFRQIEVKGFDASQYQVEQVFYDSKDGTRVPMFITSKKVNVNSLFQKRDEVMGEVSSAVVMSSAVVISSVWLV